MDHHIDPSTFVFDIATPLHAEVIMVSNQRTILNQLLEQYRLALDPDDTPDHFFEYFAAEQALKDFDISSDEIESGLVGDGGDGGIDGLYLLVNGQLIQEEWNFADLRKNISVELIVVQAKTHNGFQETPVERFITVSEDLLNLDSDAGELSEIFNEQVVELMTRFHAVYKELTIKNPSLKLTFVYACKGDKPGRTVQRKVGLLKQAVEGQLPACMFDFRFLGANELVELFRRQPPRNYLLPLAENPITVSAKSGFVCLANLRDFFAFITDEQGEFRSHVFESNVRDYQGATEVNEEIQETLTTPLSEDFWWLNNGVSIIASEVTMSGGKTLTIEDPQIVNGLQTSREVYKYFNETEDPETDRNILIKVMVPDDDESRDRIIKATNSQTSIQRASLRATDKIQRDIEDYLKSHGLYYDRRKNFYKNAGIPRAVIIDIPYLAQAVMAILLRRPDTARGRPSSLLKTDEDYAKVFNADYPVHVYYVCVQAMRKIEQALKSNSLDVVRKDRSNLRFYVGMHAVAGAAKHPLPPAEIAKFDVDRLDDAAIKKSLAVVKKLYEDLGATDQVAKGPQLLQDILRYPAHGEPSDDGTIPAGETKVEV
ncbi:MAG: AIPR family protein [Dehalococcoidia bacterium]|nr:AIPR family protein [Dehalococcoidia bacterium]